MTLKRGRSAKIVLTPDGRNRLVAFFSILIAIDKRINEKKKETKEPKIRNARKGSLKMRVLFLFKTHLSLNNTCNSNLTS